MALFTQLTLTGLTNGAVYALIALGVVVIYAVDGLQRPATRAPVPGCVGGVGLREILAHQDDRTDRTGRLGPLGAVRRR